ncbi:MAG: hypothetical protein ACTSYJ_09905 [Candidatus Thorarchaeota archaeon]
MSDQPQILIPDLGYIMSYEETGFTALSNQRKFKALLDEYRKALS